MTVTAWRVVRKKYTVAPHHPLDGKGSALEGGRWNSVGVPVVYLSAFRSLAVLETLVYAGELAAMTDRVIYPVTFPDALVEEVEPTGLPDDWHFHQAPVALQAIGDEWVKQQRSAVLLVPSAVVTGEPNYMLNPSHPDFRLVVIGPRQPLPLDPRLLSKPTSSAS